MNYKFVTLTFFLTKLLTLATSLPVNPKVVQEETVAVYVPYDVKYVPVEVPGKLLNVDPLNSKSSGFLEPIVLAKEDVLKHFNGKSGTVKPISRDDATNNEDLVVVPLSTIAKALKVKTVVKPTAPKEELEVQPLTAHDRFNEQIHRVTKRQAERFPFYRPVFRYSSLSSSRRITGPSRRHAMVGYLNDRDYFPTVA